MAVVEGTELYGYQHCTGDVVLVYVHATVTDPRLMQSVLASGHRNSSGPCARRLAEEGYADRQILQRILE
eukprot:38295-Rhodomonas_salina.5